MSKTINKQHRIGILGGTFDPIHKGHIEPVKDVFKEFQLDKILVIPAHKPPHKQSTSASTKHRVKMVELVCETEQGFEIDTRETLRSSLSYTVDTINELKAEYPNSQLFFIMGMDSLLSFTRWHLWENILEQCNLIVNTRPGYDLSTLNKDTEHLLSKYQNSITELDKDLKNSPKQVFPINKPSSGYIYLHNCEELNISSTNIREHIADLNNTSQWLTKNIADYIKKNALYTG